MVDSQLKTKLYYFSGTGNSLKSARDISEKLGNTELILIPKIINQDITIKDMLIR